MNGVWERKWLCENAAQSGLHFILKWLKIFSSNIASFTRLNRIKKTPSSKNNNNKKNNEKIISSKWSMEKSYSIWSFALIHSFTCRFSFMAYYFYCVQCCICRYLAILFRPFQFLLLLFVHFTVEEFYFFAHTAVYPLNCCTSLIGHWLHY